MAPLSKLVKRGAVRANGLPLRNDLKRGRIAPLVEHLTCKARGRELASRSGRLFSRTFTFQIFVPLLNASVGYTP